MGTLKLEGVSLKKQNSATHLTMETRAIVKHALYVDLHKYRQEKHAGKSDNAFRRYLSEKTKISQASIFNFMKREDKTIPTNENIYKIYSAIYDSKDFNDIRKKINPVIDRYLEETEINTNAINEAILKHENKFNSAILANDIRKSIYYLTSGNGCTVEFIRNEFGKRGVEELGALVEIDAVRINQGFATRGGVYLQKNIKDGNDLLSTIIKNYGPNEDQDSPWHQKYFIGNLSNDACKKIREELRNLDIKLNEIVNSDNSYSKENNKEQNEKMFFSTILSSVE